MDTKTEFSLACQKFLSRLATYLEKLDHPHLDCEYLHETVEVRIPDGGVFILHPHAASQQMWLASPCSGAHHYRFDARAQCWLSTQPGPDLAARLSEEFSEIAGDKIWLENLYAS